MLANALLFPEIIVKLNRNCAEFSRYKRSGLWLRENQPAFARSPTSEFPTMITLYDIAAKDQIKGWAPNPWKARYVLNLKKLPYRTVFVDFEDVDRVVREAGIPPSRHNADGKPVHTVPSIIDDATGAAVTDSYKIAEYLDKQYPDTPKAFPAGTEALQGAFYRYYNDNIREIALLLLPSVPNVLSKEASLEYFYRTRAAIFGKPVDQIRPVGEEEEKMWEKLHALFNSLDEWYAKSSGPFLVGDTPSFGDFTLAGMFKSMQVVCGVDNEDWKELSTMNNGRWGKLMSDLETYAIVEN
ncbi:hypothetical protein D9756_009569 [Leucocoprinus leucothites]|uniref:GST N-terminal domain-containing protein n=1 Tax=Leucocoprinus leucothites TaxID=201217 RepID=A0A8H5CV98_9AGAR|nr:hypothetical protein D9756_009569 [Leucoagaricus leucothites]